MSAFAATRFTDKARIWNPFIHVQNYKLSRFTPKLTFAIDTPAYLIKTAETQMELREVLRLRHEVFIQEGLGQTKLGHLDFDKFDLSGDHILLIDKSSYQIVGTYRIQCSDWCRSFYSETEFEMSEFLSLNTRKLELGRACIKKEYRKGVAIHLIWKGLGRYASLTKADQLFGCTSVKIYSEKQATSLIETLTDNQYSDEFAIRPRLRFQYANQAKKFSPQLCSVENLQDMIPPLMRSYLKAGAKVYGRPAYDKDFKCSDFLTVLDLKTMPLSYERKYLSI